MWAYCHRIMSGALTVRARARADVEKLFWMGWDRAGFKLPGQLTVELSTVCMPIPCMCTGKFNA